MFEAFIGPRSVRGRCACPSGSTKVFVGNYGIRCGVVRKVKGQNRKRFAFIPTPKACNYLPERSPKPISAKTPKQRKVAAQHRARVQGGPGW
jgi:hypothetical protein